MNEKSYINIMLLGYTAAGKSSLLNYIFGSRIAETGTGKPVTPKGEFKKITIPSPLKRNVSINFFDSWGLEANKADEWNVLIQGKLNENPNGADIIHGVIYCISYSRDRIEDFEIEILKDLFSRGYKVVIAFTQADNSTYEKKKLVYRKVLSEKLGTKFKDASAMVDVSAAPTKKLFQKEVIPAFGKDELLKQIEKNIDLNIKNVSLYVWQKWKNESLQKVADEKKNLLNKINRFYIKVYDAEDFFRRMTTTKTKRAKELRDTIARSLENLQKEVFGIIQNDTNCIRNFYEIIVGSVYSEKRSRISSTNGMKVDLSDSNFTDGSLTTGLASSVLKMVPIIGVFQIALEKGFLQDELKIILDKNIEAIKTEITTQYTNASSSLLNDEKTFNDSSQKQHSTSNQQPHGFLKCKACGQTFVTGFYCPKCFSENFEREE
jgi:predicted GTPase